MSWNKTRVCDALDGMRLRATPGMNIQIKAVSPDDLDISTEIVNKLLQNVLELQSEIHDLMSRLLSEAAITTTQNADVGINLTIPDTSGIFSIVVQTNIGRYIPLFYYNNKQ